MGGPIVSPQAERDADSLELQRQGVHFRPFCCIGTGDREAGGGGDRGHRLPRPLRRLELGGAARHVCEQLERSS